MCEMRALRRFASVGSNLKKLKFGSGGARSASEHNRAADPRRISLDRCLLVSKVTRYEFERFRHRGANDVQIEQLIRRRGSDYEALVHYHKMQKEFERRVQAALTECGAQVKLANRLTYSPSLIDWCDVVVPCGGDGTFLLAASRVRDSRKPVIGFNSDPSRSEGRLCLPKWCSADISKAIKTIKEGNFTWLHRSRIRTTIATDERFRSMLQDPPQDLHKPILPRYNVCDASDDLSDRPQIAANSFGVEPNRVEPNWDEQPFDRNNQPGIFKRTLPYLALNEVFIGENVSARVSHLQLKIDENQRSTRTKCSGLCVSTGTGSTSWHLSINCLRTQSVKDLLQLWSVINGNESPTDDTINNLTKLYNDKLIFSPDDTKLAYTVRELISGDVWPSCKGLQHRGFANKIHIKSRCVDAGLVIDGGMSFPFNDGTEATLQINPEDSLMTISLEVD